MVEPALPLLMVLFGTFLAVLAKFLNDSLPKKIRPPYSVVLFAIGLILGALNHQKWFNCPIEEEEGEDGEGEGEAEQSNENPEAEGEGAGAEGGEPATEAAEQEAEEEKFEQFGLGCFLGPGAKSLTDIDPDIIILVMLPPILFLSTFEVNWHVLKRTAWQSIVLAFPGVGFSAVLLAAFCKYAITFDNNVTWSWTQAMVVGSILAATDPVAVVAALSELGAPQKLTTIIEGESLLNDGSAFVLFILFEQILSGESDRTVAQMFLYFFQLALGGPLWGVFLGWLTYIWLRAVYNDVVIETTLSLAGAYLVFWSAEEILDVSPVLAVVCYGFYFAYRAKFAYSPEVEEKNEAVWSVVAYVSESLIFIIAGLIIWQSAVETAMASKLYNWIMLVVLFIVLNVVRYIMVLFFAPILTRLGGGLTLKEAVILGYGGLRGAVSLSLALITHKEVPDKAYTSQVLFFIAGLVALTLIVNGMTCELVYNVLKMVSPTDSAVQLTHRALEHLDSDVDLVVSKLKQNWFYESVVWERMLRVIPRLQAVQFKGHKMIFEFPRVSWLFKGGGGKNETSAKSGMGKGDMEMGSYDRRPAKPSGQATGERTGVTMYVRDSWIDDGNNANQEPAPAYGSSNSSPVHLQVAPAPGQRAGSVRFDVDDAPPRRQNGGNRFDRQTRSIRDIHMDDVTRESVMFLEMDEREEEEQFARQSGYYPNGQPYQQDYYDEQYESSEQYPPEKGGYPGSGDDAFRNHGAARPVSMMTDVLKTDPLEKYKVFFNALRASYHSQYMNGVLGDAPLQKLFHAVDAAIDSERLEFHKEKKAGGFGKIGNLVLSGQQRHLQSSDAKVDFTNPNKIDVEFQVLKRSIELSGLVLKLRSVPVISIFSDAYLYEQLHFAVAALISYINAHYAVISNFDNSYTGVRSLKAEVLRNIQEAKETIQRLREMYPDLIKSITTVLAVSMVLRVQRDKLKHLAHEGVVEVSTVEELSSGLDGMLAKLKTSYKPMKM